MKTTYLFSGSLLTILFLFFMNIALGAPTQSPPNGGAIKIENGAPSPSITVQSTGALNFPGNAPTTRSNLAAAASGDNNDITDLASTMHFRSSKVGIGTTSPSGVLDLGSATGGRALSWGGTSANYTNIFSSYSGAGLVMAAGLRGNTSTDTYLSSYGSSIARAAIRLNPFSASDAGSIQFFTDPSSTVADGTAITPTERMRISSGGNVGIGTDSPDGRLDVEGVVPGGSVEFYLKNITTDAAGVKTRISMPVFNAAGGLFIDSIGNSVDGYAGHIHTGQTSSKLFLGAGSGANKHITILSGGNVGIGATSPGALLQLGQSASPAKLGVLGLAGSTSGMVSLQPAAAAGTWTLTLPTSTGTSGQFLQTNGSGVTSWATAGGAPTNATYITQTADSTLSAEQALGSLATGILKNTTTTGVLSIAAAGTDYESPLTFSAPLSRSGNTVSLTTPVSVTNGGTGANLSTTGGSTSFVRQSTSGGAFSVGTILDADVPNTITLDNLTQITTRAISDTTGTLAVGRGGTGATTLTTNGVLLGNGASAISATAAGTADQVLRVPSAGGAPVFGAVNLASSSAVTGALPVANGGTGLASLTANGVLIGNGTSNPTFVTPGTAENVLKSNGTTWVSAANPAGWNVSGSKVVLSTIGNSVGIGIDPPIAKLHVKGNGSSGTGQGQVTTSTSSTPANNPDHIVQGSLTSTTNFGATGQVQEGDTITISDQTRTVVKIVDADTLHVDAAFNPQFTLATSYSFQPPIAKTVTDGGVARLTTNTRGTLLQASGTTYDSYTMVIADSTKKPNLYIADNGHMGIKRKPESGYVIAIDGGATATGTWQDSSDARLKKNITKLSNILEKIKNINGVYYDWRKDEFPDKIFSDKRQLGLIAQEVEKEFPELVGYDDEGYRSLAYGHFVPILLEAIKEQQMEIESQETQIKEQGDLLKSLKADIELIKAAIK